MPDSEIISLDISKKLKSNFYQCDVLKVAKNLLGKVLVKINNEEVLAAKIVEVEAYKGNCDKAAHSYAGKTARNEVMFKPGGFLYVYFIYGVHYCANVVTGREGDGDAILLRAAEPLLGIDKMKINRYNTPKINNRQFLGLTNGPAKLAKAFDLDRNFNGNNLITGNIFIAEFEKIASANIRISKRIGISKSKDLPWRFYIKNNKFLSR